MRITRCPVCETNAREDAKSLEGYLQPSFRIIKCENCNHCFTFFEAEVDIDKYYDEMDYAVKDNRGSFFHTIQEIEYKKVLKRLNALGSGKDLLDFGSGKGVFLSFAKQKDFEVVGVETSKPRAEYARKTFGVEVSVNVFSSGRIFDRRFPVITMFHVLEHIPDARSFLKNLYADNLAPGGIALIEVPNFGSFQSKWAKGRWLHIDIPRHVSHFTEESLNKCIDGLGLSLVKKDTFSWHLGIIGMTQTVMSWFGYRGFLLGDLKAKKSIGLLLRLGMAVPVALLLEWIAGLCGKGGVIRYYLKYKEQE